MNVLLTGGLGYIGSHTALELIREGHQGCLLDNLSNSDISVLSRLENLVGREIPFVKMDIIRKKDFQKLNSFQFEAVIHFAAKKSITESIEKPLDYYQGNITGLLNVMEYIKLEGISNLVFSSSCTVYCTPDHIPVDETAPTKVSASPYGNTIRWEEEILMEYSMLSEGLKTILLRYLIPVGADKSGQIGELPNGVPNNLMPFITQTAAGIRKKLQIFGSDYTTSDGTAIRDFIQVSDLAKAHVAALNYMGIMPENIDVFNIGTGKGITILEMVKAFEKENNIKVNYQFADLRPGDLDQIWAKSTKANEILKWKPELGLKEMVASAWLWQKNLNGGLRE